MTSEFHDSQLALVVGGARSPSADEYRPTSDKRFRNVIVLQQVGWVKRTFGAPAERVCNQYTVLTDAFRSADYFSGKFRFNEPANQSNQPQSSVKIRGSV